MNLSLGCNNNSIFDPFLDDILNETSTITTNPDAHQQELDTGSDDNPMSLSTEVSMTDIFKMVFVGVISGFILTANACTLVTIWKTPGLRTLTNAFIACLAVTDLITGTAMILAGLFVYPPTRVSLFHGIAQVCVLMHGFGISTLMISVWIMVYISIERYLYICHPYLYPRVVTKRSFTAAISVAWIFTTVYAFLPQLVYNRDVSVCDITRRIPPWYWRFCPTSLYYAAVIVIATMYTLILRTALSQSKLIQTSALRPTNDTQHNRHKNGVHRSTLKSVKLFFSVFVVFFVCITPNVLLFSFGNDIEVSSEIWSLSTLLATTNSGMNFLIYGIQNKQFRQALVKVICCRRR